MQPILRGLVVITATLPMEAPDLHAPDRVAFSGSRLNEEPGSAVTLDHFRVAVPLPNSLKLRAEGGN